MACETGLVAPSSTGLSVASGELPNTTVVQIKSGAGQLCGWNLSPEGSGGISFVQFFDALAASVTLGTTVPILSIALFDVTGAIIISELLSALGITFSNGLSIAATATRAGSGAANFTVAYNIFFA